MLRAPAWLTFSLVLAGCVSIPQDAAPAAGVAPDAGARLLAHASAGLVPVPPGFEALAALVSPTGYARGEPTVGVTSDGTIFAAAGDPLVPPAARDAAPAAPLANVGPTVILRSRDHGATWEALRSPFFDPAVDFDPWVWVDAATDRVFHVPLYVACSWVAMSDDGGESWDASPAGGCGLPAHDHQKLTSGPAPASVVGAWEDRVVYYAYNSFRGEGTVVSTSLEGGRTWSAGVVAHPADECYGGLNGPVAVAPDGTAYLPKPTCDDVAVAVSRDGGATWEQATPITQAGMAAHLDTLHAAVDSAGNVFVAFTGEDELLHLAASADGGQSWQVHVASPPALRSVVFSDIVAGADGRVALAYVATETDPATWPEPDPSVATDDTVWHLYLAYVEDALAADPTFVSLRVTPEDDPVQRGCVWLRGGSEPCRNLRDFIGMVERDGRVYVAYADGCDRCASAAESRRLGETTIAIVEGGPSLRGGLLPALPTHAAAREGDAPPRLATLRDLL